MIRGMLGKKVGMTQVFDNDGNITPVTVLEPGPCVVLELKENPLKIKLGYQPAKETQVRKPQLGYFKKLGIAPQRFIKEFHSTDNKDYTPGKEIKADFFRAGDFVNVTATSIGKGFQGGMKRWHWKGGPAAHGSMHHRRIGSIGASTFPSRVFKGHHMPGHMGTDTVTVQNLRVMRVDTDKNLIAVKGAVPGHTRAVVVIEKSLKKAFRSLDEKKEVVVSKRNPMKQSKAKAAGK